jgi:hypothetical protein
MFIKHGDGKIVSVFDEDKLTEEQKKAVKDISKQVVKQSDKSDSSDQQKKSGS